MASVLPIKATALKLDTRTGMLYMCKVLTYLFHELLYLERKSCKTAHTYIYHHYNHSPSSSNGIFVGLSHFWRIPLYLHPVIYSSLHSLASLYPLPFFTPSIPPSPWTSQPSRMCVQLKRAIKSRDVVVRGVSECVCVCV